VGDRTAGGRRGSSKPSGSQGLRMAFEALAIVAIGFTLLINWVSDRLPTYPAGMQIAVIGDSISETMVDPDSPEECLRGDRAGRNCLYSHDRHDSYPAILGERFHANITNLAVWGSRTDQMIANQVPHVPADANIVIYEGGSNDLRFGGVSTLRSIDTVVGAIRERAPHARLIVIGVRHFTGSRADDVRAWNEREQEVAHSVGASFVEMASAFPASDYRDWPDGIHPSAEGVRKIGSVFAIAIERLETR
jgi:lysophospholipase L1-like esterase